MGHSPSSATENAHQSEREATGNPSPDAKSLFNFRAFVDLLKDRDPHKRYPLPINIMWAWNQVAKDDTGTIRMAAKAQVVQTLSSFDRHVGDNDIVSLVHDCCGSKPGYIGEETMQTLLSKAGGRPASRADARAVLAHVRSLSRNTHGGYGPHSGSDPDLLSKAIFLWWIDSDGPGCPGTPPADSARCREGAPAAAAGLAPGGGCGVAACGGSRAVALVRPDAAPWAHIGDSLAEIWLSVQEGLQCTNSPSVRRDSRPVRR